MALSNEPSGKIGMEMDSMMDYSVAQKVDVWRSLLDSLEKWKIRHTA